METSERIKTLRKSKKLSQEQFGEMLGVSRDVIGNIEYDRLKRPEQKEPIYKLICSTFNINEHWLRTGEGKMEQSTAEDYVGRLKDEMGLSDTMAEILLIYANMPSEEKDVVDEFIKLLKKQVLAGSVHNLSPKAKNEKKGTAD